MAASLQATEGHYPERTHSLQNLALVHFRMGRLNNASTALKEAEDLSRNVHDTNHTVKVLVARAGVELARGNFDLALADLEQVFEICPDNAYPREMSLTYRTLAQLHEAKGELNRAQRCLEKAWKLAVEIFARGRSGS